MGENLKSGMYPGSKVRLSAMALRTMAAFNLDNWNGFSKDTITTIIDNNDKNFTISVSGDIRGKENKWSDIYWELVKPKKKLKLRDMLK